jgi:hypothetical protein
MSPGRRRVHARIEVGRAYLDPGRRMTAGSRWRSESRVGLRRSMKGSAKPVSGKERYVRSPRYFRPVVKLKSRMSKTAEATKKLRTESHPCIVQHGPT